MANPAPSLSDPEALPNGKVTYASGDGVALVTLTNPPANGYSLEMMRDIDEAVLRARFDDAVQVVVLAGEGEKFFCAGADISMLHGVTQSFKYYFCLHANETLMRLERTPKLFIAALSGHCVGGLEVALACDLRIARRGSGRCGLPEVSLGVLPGTGGTQRLARLVGKSRAIELMAGGDLFDYERAVELGVVNETLEADDDAGFLAAVLERARGYCTPGKAAMSVGHIKLAVQAGVDLDLEAGLALERELQAKLFASGDAAEGIAAFVEKRAAEFKGQLMQVARIHAHGGPEVLAVDEIEAPEPGPGEVLVRVLAVSVNHLDLWVRRGMPGVKVPFPRILGCDGTGEIAARGQGVEGLAVGQKVVLEPGFSSGQSAHDAAGNDHLSDDYGVRGEHGDGFDAEYVVLASRFALPLPEGLDPVQAASAPLAFLTAWGMLVTRASLTPDDTVLVLAGSSGVGTAAIQVARQAGARVIATAGSDAKRQLCLDLGAEVAVDHYADEWFREVKQLTDGRGADIVVEHVGPATWASSMRCIARNGRLVTCGATTGPVVEVPLPHLFIKNLSLLGSTMGPRAALPTIMEYLAAGRYRTSVDEVLPLSEVRRAHERLEAGDVAGKLVLVPGR